MKKNMWMAGILLFILGIFMLPTASAKAATISYQDAAGAQLMDSTGNPITDDSTAVKDDSTPDPFKNLNLAFADATFAETHGTKVIVVDPEDHFQGITEDAAAAITQNTTYRVIATKDVTASGTLGAGKWYIKNGALYICSESNTAIDSEGALGYSRDPRTSHTNDGFDIVAPEIKYGDITSKNWGIKNSYVFDEKDRTTAEYYEYVADPADADGVHHQDIADRTANEISNINYATLPSAEGFKAETVPWREYAGEITSVYLAKGVKFAGNLGFWFNGNSQIVSDDNPFVNYKKVGSSIYSNLENVEIYCDMSEVLSTAGMFARCPKLQRVKTGEDANSYTFGLLQYTSFMFFGCERLTSAEDDFLDKMDMSPATTDTLVSTEFMFAGCKELDSTHVNLAEIGMSHVTGADGMFYGCDSANILFNRTVAGAKNNVVDWDVSTLRSAKFMFSGVIPADGDGNPDYNNCMADIDPGLGEFHGGNVINGVVDLYNWNSAVLGEGMGMFAKNDAITQVNLTNGTAGGMPALLDASDMFLLCQNLKTVQGAAWNTPALVHTTAMFRGCGRNYDDGSATADLSNWICGSLENVDMMFSSSGFSSVNLDGCSDMHTVSDAVAMFADMPYLTSLGSNGLAHIRFSNIVSGEYMFHNDNGLQALNMRDWGMNRVESIAHMFDGCGGLEDMNVASWSISNALKDMECFAYKSGCSEIDLTSWDTSNVTNMFMSFANCGNLTSFKAPSGDGKLASVKTMNGMFYNDPKLRTATGFGTGTALTDVRGMFAEDITLNTVEVGSLVTNATESASFMFRNDRALSELDLGNWNTVNVKFMEGMFQSCKELTTITTGNNWSGAKVKNMGKMFKNCTKLTSASLNGLLSHMTGTVNLEDMFEMALDCYALTSLDLSPMDLSVCTDLIRVAAMEESNATRTNNLTTIKVPSTILTAEGVCLTDNADGHGNSINMFWVDGDGTGDGDTEEDKADDDLLTTFFVKGDIPENLAAYGFGGTDDDNDNRRFIEFDGRTINNEDTGTYSFTSPTDTALLRVLTTSSFYKNGTETDTATNVAPEFSWEKDDEPVTGSVGVRTVGNADAGVYKATAKPGELTGSNYQTTATFTLNAAPVIEKKIEATYKGGNIVVGNAYEKDDVEVMYTNSLGTTTKLTSSVWNADSYNVTKVGDNTYTVFYDPGDGTLKDTITVVGVEEGKAFISATYTGDPVKMGESYDKSEVTVVYTDKDGVETTLSDGDFTVDSLEVTKVGDNSYTASYTPTGGKELTDKFTVKGIEADPVITATYSGDSVPVGSNYNKDDVEVVLTTGDGKTVELTSNDFTVDSQKVTKEGNNNYTAKYKTAAGEITAKFTVPGKRVVGSIDAEYVGPSVMIGEPYNKEDIITTAYYADDTSRSEGFEVKPTSYSTKIVKAVGDNNVTVSYKDPDTGKVYSDTVAINGYKPVSSITAEYLGDKIKVGKSYNKDNVKVTLYYSDGSGSEATKNFTVDSTTVSYEGDNSYVATYKDPYGNTYSASFTVPGYTDSSSSSSDKKSSSSSNYNPYNPYNLGSALGDYFAPLSTIFNPNGSGTATGMNPINYGSSTGAVKTGTTGMTVLYVLAIIVAASVLGYCIYWKRKNGHDKKDDK